MDPVPSTIVKYDEMIALSPGGNFSLYRSLCENHAAPVISLIVGLV